MKKFYILLIAMFMLNGTRAQSCFPQGTNFLWQAQIDNFQTNNPNCTQIEGAVFIGNSENWSAIYNLNGLNVLTSIGGNVYISGTALTSLAGLDNVISIGGDLTIGYQKVTNPSLTSLSGLEGLTSIGGGFVIWSNPALTSMTGLNNITSIGGGIEIIENDALTSLTALKNLTSIGGEVLIYMNYTLASLTGLDNIDAGSIGDLDVEYNDSLSTCEVQSICDYLASPNGTITIEGNAEGCNSREEVEAACGVFIEDLIHRGLFSIYPNPSSDNITIETSVISTPIHLSIMNLNGQKIMTRQITGPKTHINISTLPSGVYFVRLTNERTVEVGKMVKQ